MLKTTTGLAAAGSVIATAGCLGGGGSDLDLDEEVTTEGPVEVSTTALAATDDGYELAITVTNDSENPADVGCEVVWTDSNDENVAVTGSDTKTADAGGETTLTVTAEDPNDAIVAYSVTVLAAPA
ncbi:hypothetical protein C467_09349 [Halorubrum hochstenium ATCC 700873]|uniref:Uncharacterized protein n=1 Tax=Halorubrum hochstenium ATCC 700873 TaxID=1227481 RepID=M0F680_9EURY|nr:hypothetical protein C467_09349 [Halorubrum hochstenium ATCC 700873]